MNKQAKNGYELMLLSRAIACEEIDCWPDELSYWAWPVVYETTGGPFKHAIRLHTLTSFTLEAYSAHGKYCVFCQGKLLQVVEAAEFVLGATYYQEKLNETPKPAED